MTKLKDFKKERRKRQMLLLTLRLMEWAAILLFAGCAVKTFLLALIDADILIVFAGALCSVAALFIGTVIEKLRKEVRHGMVTRLRQMENNGARAA